MENGIRLQDGLIRANVLEVETDVIPLTRFFTAATMYISPFNFPARKKSVLPLISRILGRNVDARPVDFGTDSSRSKTWSSWVEL